MTARTAFTVKKPATTIITTATATFLPIMLIDVIHPLSTTKTNKRVISHVLYSVCLLYNIQWIFGTKNMNFTEVEKLDNILICHRE